MEKALAGIVQPHHRFVLVQYQRLAARRGKKRAIVAVAHSMLVSAWHMLTYQQPYRELGGDYFDRRKRVQSSLFGPAQGARIVIRAEGRSRRQETDDPFILPIRGYFRGSA